MQPLAYFAGQWASDLVEVTDDLAVLDGSGRWAVLIPYDGLPVLARFARWEAVRPEASVGSWIGPTESSWRSSMDRAAYVAAVERTRAAIEAGTVYQANICRVLSADLPRPDRADVAGLHALLAAGNPAPFGGFLRLPEHRVEVVTASPELFLRLHRDDGVRRVCTGPIKGTAAHAHGLRDKDRAENVMIVDLMRNDLSRVCAVGTVRVPQLLRVESHPGLVHLVSDVAGDLDDGATWTDLLGATFPPGSVTGAPKRSACEVIARLEPAARGPYCGAIGWVDADTGAAELAVAIRTFWVAEDRLHFGTGAGITWGSDAAAEWAETMLKADRLVRVAAGRWDPGSSTGDGGGR